MIFVKYINQIYTQGVNIIMSLNETATNKPELTPLQWAEKACDTLMAKFEPENLPPFERFHYHQGVFLLGMQNCYKENHKEKYYDYLKRWVDSLIMPDGTVTHCDTNELDDIQPGILLFDL